MTDERTPATAGILASVAALAVVFGPYLVLTSNELAGLRAYYSYGLVGPWAVAMLALVSIVAFAAGREHRTDPVTIAGATLVFGVVAAVIALLWAVSVPGELVQQIGTAAWLSYHRWLLAATSVGLLASAGWYTRALGIV